MYVLIDSPVSPYSSVADIKKWIETLKKMKPSEQRDAELEKARMSLLFLQK